MKADELARALGGAHKTGDTWMARCPAHEDGTPSLAIRERQGRLLLRCHANCSQVEVLGALQARGLWGGEPRQEHRPPPRARAEEDRDAERRTAYASRLFASAGPAAGSPIQTAYFPARGLTLAPPPSLRYVASLEHKPTGLRLPAMVAAVRDVDGRFMAVHRTFLRGDGGRVAPISQAKMMLGPCAGGAVRLSPVGPQLAIGEGIETVLSVMQSEGLAGWAALSAGGLKAVKIPPEVVDVIVLADGDDTGRAAAQECADRLRSEGRRARIAQAPDGKDFNDLLREAA